jgi:hypothetical protein
MVEFVDFLKNARDDYKQMLRDLEDREDAHPEYVAYLCAQLAAAERQLEMVAQA